MDNLKIGQFIGCQKFSSEILFVDHKSQVVETGEAEDPRWGTLNLLVVIVSTAAMIIILLIINN